MMASTRCPGGCKHTKMAMFSSQAVDSRNERGNISGRKVAAVAAAMASLASVITLMVITGVQAQTVTYSFTQFPYKESVANEKVWSEYEVACAQSPRCLELRGVHHTRCVRQCVSPSCYLDIYIHDELEEGEIDVRLASFKGCFLKRMSRQRRP